jgi:hypothetical protein
MIRLIAKYVIYFVFLVLIQVTVLNHINFMDHVNPYIYILFILALPFSVSKSGVLLLSFLMGFTIDLFVATPGINAAAMVFLGFLRNILLPFLEPRDNYEPGTHPSVAEYGWAWYMRYAVILVVLHHIALFFLDAFSLKNGGTTLIYSLYSSVFTLILIVLSQSSTSKRTLLSE